MKRGYLWLDWVELGCRGWDLTDWGGDYAVAEYSAEENRFDYYTCLVYDKLSMSWYLHFSASPEHAVNVYNDLLAAGIFRHKQTQSQGRQMLPDTFTSNSSSINYVQFDL